MGHVLQPTTANCFSISPCQNLRCSAALLLVLYGDGDRLTLPTPQMRLIGQHAPFEGPENMARRTNLV